MPYISIKAYPKDKAIKEAVAEKINAVFLELWGCPQEAISISIEEVIPSDWEEKIVKPEIEPNKKKMLVLFGEKLYKPV